MTKLPYLFLLILTLGCTNLKQEVTPQCKAEINQKISYQDDVKAIIEKNCNSCHNNKSHSCGVKSRDLDDLKFWTNSGEL